MRKLRLYLSEILSHWETLVSLIIFILTFLFWVVFIAINYFKDVISISKSFEEFITNYQDPISIITPAIWVFSFMFVNFSAFSKVYDELSELKKNKPNIRLVFNNGNSNLKVQIPNYESKLIDDYCTYLRNFWDDYQNIYYIRNVSTVNKHQSLEDYEEHRYFIENKKVFENYVNEMSSFLKNILYNVVELVHYQVFTIDVENIGNTRENNLEINIKFPRNMKIYNQDDARQLINKISNLNPPKFPDIKELKEYIYYAIDKEYRLMIYDNFSVYYLRNVFGNSFIDCYDNIYYNLQNILNDKKFVINDEGIQLDSGLLPQKIGKRSILCGLFRFSSNALYVPGFLPIEPTNVDIEYSILGTTNNLFIQDTLNLDIEVIN